MLRLKHGVVKKQGPLLVAAKGLFFEVFWQLLLFTSRIDPVVHQLPVAWDPERRV